MEKSISVLRVETSLPQDEASSGEVAVGVEQGGENTPAEPQTIVVEIVDARLKVALHRRHEDVMKRTLRHWDTVSSTDVGRSNFSKITF